MSHDLKSPLRTITSFSNLLKRSLAKKNIEDKDMEFVDFISDSANAMSELIEDLLLYSKIEIEDYQFKTTNLNEIITLVLPVFKFDIDQKKVQIEVGELPSIEGQHGVLKTIFHNLISNGIKYQPKDKIHYQIKIKIWASERETSHLIFIEDNGIGIKQEYIKDLFTPFHRFHSSADYKGSGLGMSICQRIMKKHKGEISLKSTSENGSTLQLMFPKNQTIDVDSQEAENISYI